MRGTTKTKKKITEVKAFKTANGCIWENKLDAVDDQINDILSTLSSEEYNNHNKFAQWLVNNEKDILWVIKVVKNGGEE